MESQVLKYLCTVTGLTIIKFLCIGVILVVGFGMAVNSWSAIIVGILGIGLTNNMIRTRLEIMKKLLPQTKTDTKTDA